MMSLVPWDALSIGTNPLLHDVQRVNGAFLGLTLCIKAHIERGFRDTGSFELSLRDWCHSAYIIFSRIQRLGGDISAYSELCPVQVWWPIMLPR